MMADPKDAKRRLLLPGKSNLTAVQTGLAFSIAGEPGAVHWEPKPVEMTADEALAQEQGTRRDNSALDEATTWLGNALAGGARPGTEVRAEAERDGIAARTLDRARAKLKVKVGPSCFGGQWMWQLPNTASVSQDSPEFANHEMLADSAETVADSDTDLLDDVDEHDREAEWLDASF